MQERNNIVIKDIEKRSFEIITQELGDVTLDPEQEPIIKRCIHTSADFDYYENLCSIGSKSRDSKRLS